LALTDLLSFQLFTSRTAGTLEEQFKRLADLGYTNVEGFGDTYGYADEMRALLTKYKLTAKSGHFHFAQIDGDFDGVVRIARNLGMGTIGTAYLPPPERPTEVEGWKRFGERLEIIARRLDAEGIRYMWHNHDYEFVTLQDGQVGLDHLLSSAETLWWQADIAWQMRGASDPAIYLTKYADRIPSFHVKDLGLPGSNPSEDDWVDLGSGIVPWDKLWPIATATSATLAIVEHDLPKDWSAFAELGAGFVTSLAAKTI
jgi:sugar phosphate isomerase/epimerase